MSAAAAVQTLDISPVGRVEGDLDVRVDSVDELEVVAEVDGVGVVEVSLRRAVVDVLAPGVTRRHT